MAGGGKVGFPPGIFVCRFGCGDLTVETLRDSLAILHHDRPDLFDAEPFDECVRPFENLAFSR